MYGQQIHQNSANPISRCERRAQIPGQSLSPVEKNDAALKEDIANVLWKDDALRSLDYYGIDIRVDNGTVTFNGHITSSSSQHRVKNAIRAIPGIVKVNNNLVSDDKLTLDVASALGGLEHEYGCKFFTGASHGVVSINGTVRDGKIRSLAEKCASDTPNTRGVINNVQVAGKKPEVMDQRFFQPAIGEPIYFLDWASGTVKQVIMNPDNRRVIAMVVLGKFPDRQNESKPEGNTSARERLIVIPVSSISYLTKVSGFLHINSRERNRYTDFTPANLLPLLWNGRLHIPIALMMSYSPWRIMKKIFKLSANLAAVHSRRYRRLPHLESNFPLRVTWVDGTQKDSLKQRQPYVFMRRHLDGISRSMFVFTTPKKAKVDAGSILRWEDDGGEA